MSNFQKYRNKETGEIVTNPEISSHLSSGCGLVTAYSDSRGKTKTIYTTEFEQKFEEVTNES